MSNPSGTWMLIFRPVVSTSVAECETVAGDATRRESRVRHARIWIVILVAVVVAAAAGAASGSAEKRVFYLTVHPRTA